MKLGTSSTSVRTQERNNSQYSGPLGYKSSSEKKVRIEVVIVLEHESDSETSEFVSMYPHTSQ